MSGLAAARERAAGRICVPISGEGLPALMSATRTTWSVANAGALFDLLAPGTPDNWTAHLQLVLDVL